jgi:adenine-specific DNA-methyltransferase
MNKIESTSLDLEKLNVEKIKEFFPNVVTEGKIDFDKLKVILGDQVDDRVEKYQFTWNGKSNTIKLAQSPSTGTLIPSKDDSKNWDTTGNLYIEGDNLEVLKQLQKTYYGKIKMIYIDPPYNTGGDFVYKDDFKDNIQNYKEQTKQTSRANPETNGRYHTDWLNMMYSRLILAKNLLSPNGSIFLSIDDKELDNLRKICNEIFGENNFVANLVWRKIYGVKNDSKQFSNSHEYILVYSKQSEKWTPSLLARTEKQNERYKNPDNDTRGPWKSADFTGVGTSPSCVFPIVTPSGKVINPPDGKRWIVNQERYLELNKDNRIWFGSNGDSVPSIKRFLSEVQDGIVPSTFLDYTDVGHTDEANRQLKSLMSGPFFDYPKPVRLLTRLVHIGTSESDIILDFFSGSATTAHAIMQLNAEDGGNRKFIMVQLPELTDESSEAYKAGYKNICEIGKERIRRAGEQIKQELIDKKNKACLLDDNIVDPETFDNGFKVFKLESTNIIPWDGTIKFDEDTIFSQTEVIKEDRTSLDVLYEIMLKYGVFDKPVEEIKVNGKTMYSIAKGYLIVCLDNNISLEDVKEIGKLKPRNVIFKESGFRNDNDKINATYTLEKLGVEEVKSI